MFTKFNLQKGLFGTVIDDGKFLQSNVARDGAGNPEYVGWSAPGTPEDEDGWLIIKHFYTGTDFDKSRLADASIAFDKVWDDRASYSY
jgi:hypothetical protein